MTFTAANGRTAAECYALGLDPSLATNDFRIVSIELVDGDPKVEWEPKTNRWTGAEIQATLKGAATLEGPWEDVPAGGSPGTARPTIRPRRGAALPDEAARRRFPQVAVATGRGPPVAAKYYRKILDIKLKGTKWPE